MTNRVAAAVERVDLGDKARAKLRTLSGGMLRRAGIAQAIVNEPDLLLLDEPTAGLDPEQRVAFRALLRGLGERATVVVSTHLVEDVGAACAQVALMDAGRIVFHGTPDELSASPKASTAACTLAWVAAHRRSWVSASGIGTTFSPQLPRHATNALPAADLCGSTTRHGRPSMTRPGLNIGFTLSAGGHSGRAHSGGRADLTEAVSTTRASGAACTVRSRNALWQAGSGKLRTTRSALRRARAYAPAGGCEASVPSRRSKAVTWQPSSLSSRPSIPPTAPSPTTRARLKAPGIKRSFHRRCSLSQVPRHPKITIASLRRPATM